MDSYSAAEAPESASVFYMLKRVKFMIIVYFSAEAQKPSLSLKGPSVGCLVGSDAGCQSRGCEFESRFGQLSFRRLTKVNATCVIRLPPMG